MKKSILFAGAAIMLLATACSGNKKDNDSIQGVVVDESTEVLITTDTLPNGQVVNDTTAAIAGTIEAGVTAAKQEGKEAVEAAKEKGKEAVETAKEKGKEAVDAAKDKANGAVNAAKDKAEGAINNVANKLK